MFREKDEDLAMLVLLVNVNTIISSKLGYG